MSAEQIVAPVHTDDSLIDQVQMKRVAIADQLMKEGKIPDDPKLLNALLHTLDGTASTAVANKRVKAASEVGEAITDFNAIAGKVLRQIANPSAFKTDGKEIRADRVLEVVTVNAEETASVEGETFVGIEDMNFDKFAAERNLFDK